LTYVAAVITILVETLVEISKCRRGSVGIRLDGLERMKL
jgi:hypothetical protein